MNERKQRSMETTRGSRRTPHGGPSPSDVVIDLGVADQVARLLADDPRPGNERFSIHILEPGSPHVDVAKGVEADVFVSAFTDTREEVIAHYTPYDPASMFVVLIDRENLVAAGVLRLVMMGPHGLPTFNDMETLPHWAVNLDDAMRYHQWPEPVGGFCDMTTLAVRNRYRMGGLASLALSYVTISECARRGVSRWFALVDDALLGSHHMMGIPWEPICDLPAGPHAGSDVTSPVTARFANVEPTIRARDFRFAALLIDGKGLEGRVSFPPQPSRRSLSTAL